MGTDGYQTYCGDHFITYAHVKSLHSIPETNITLHVTHTNTQTYNLTKKHRHQITREENKRRGEKTDKSKSKTINKMVIKTYISIITLNVNRLMLQLKDIDSLNGYKNKTHIYTANKRLTSNLETHMD